MGHDPDVIARPLDILIGYTPGMKMPEVRGVLTRQWHPARDGFRYRNSEDAHWFWEFRRRSGDRWHALTRKVLRGITNKKYLDRGVILIRRAIERGMIDMTDVVSNVDADRVESALAYCAGLVADVDADHKHRLVGAKTVLEFLKVKPATKVEQTLKTAEDFLDALGDGE